MADVLETPIRCPCCGETISILVDASLAEQRYVEDCQVCCRPIVLDIVVAPDGRVAVHASGENE